MKRIDEKELAEIVTIQLRCLKNKHFWNYAQGKKYYSQALTAITDRIVYALASYAIYREERSDELVLPPLPLFPDHPPRFLMRAPGKLPDEG